MAQTFPYMFYMSVLGVGLVACVLGLGLESQVLGLGLVAYVLGLGLAICVLDSITRYRWSSGRVSHS